MLGLLMTTRLAGLIDRATQYILHRLLGLGSVVRAAIKEAAHPMLEHRGGQLLDPLPD